MSSTEKAPATSAKVTRGKCKISKPFVHPHFGQVNRNAACTPQKTQGISPKLRIVRPSPPRPWDKLSFLKSRCLKQISVLRTEAEVLPGGPAHPGGGFDPAVSLVLDKLLELEECVREVRP